MSNPTGTPQQLGSVEQTEVKPVEKKKAIDKDSFLIWLFFNILLPLLPVLLKLIIHFFSKKNKINILDSSELLYYTFFICIMMLYSIFSKNRKPLLELLIAFVVFFVAFVNMAMIIMVYFNIQHEQNVKIYSIIISALVIGAACMIKARGKEETGNEQD